MIVRSICSGPCLQKELNTTREAKELTAPLTSCAGQRASVRRLKMSCMKRPSETPALAQSSSCWIRDSSHLKETHEIITSLLGGRTRSQKKQVPQVPKSIPEENKFEITIHFHNQWTGMSQHLHHVASCLWARGAWDFWILPAHTAATGTLEELNHPLAKLKLMVSCNGPRHGGLEFSSWNTETETADV